MTEQIDAQEIVLDAIRRTQETIARLETETQTLVAGAIIPLASVFQSLNWWLNTPIDETGTTPAKLMRRYK